MQTQDIKSLVQEAVKYQSLIPVRAYFIGEDLTHVTLKMPLVKDGKKLHKQCKLPKGLVYWTFNDHKRKEERTDNELLFMLIPFGLWSMTFEACYQPGSTWTAPSHFKLNTTINGN